MTSNNTISIIVGLGNNREIGLDNQIPWHLSADLKYFKKTTLGCPIIMGRKSHESIGRPLPRRTNIVITRNQNYTAQGCIIVHSLAQAIAKAKEENPTEIFVIGGGQIYQEALGLAQKLYITAIDINIPKATIFFPEINEKHWDLIQKESHQKDEKNPYDYTFKILERRP